MNSAQKFSISLFFMSLCFIFFVQCGNTKSPETIYVHDTITKVDSFARPDTVYVRDTIYRTDSLFLETAEVQNLRKTIEHQNKIIKSLMRK